MTLVPERRWDVANSHPSMAISSTGYSVRCKQPCYFSSAIGVSAMSRGNIYEFRVLIRKLNPRALVQVGVTQTQDLQRMNFSGTEKGWAFYPSWNGLKEHGGEKKQYGDHLKGSGVIGVKLDLVQGSLSFSLNGRDLGEAYHLSKIDLGRPFFPAFATCDSRVMCSFCVEFWKERLPFLYILSRSNFGNRVPLSLAREIGYLIA